MPRWSKSGRQIAPIRGDYAQYEEWYTGLLISKLPDFQRRVMQAMLHGSSVDRLAMNTGRSEAEIHRLIAEGSDLVLAKLDAHMRKKFPNVARPERKQCPSAD